MVSLKPYSDAELAALIKAKKTDAKNNIVSGVHTLDALEREQERRKKKSANDKLTRTKITKKCPKIEDLFVAIKTAAAANNCKNIDILSYCAKYLRTGHRLVKLDKTVKIQKNQTKNH